MGDGLHELYRQDAAAELRNIAASMTGLVTIYFLFMTYYRSSLALKYVHSLSHVSTVAAQITFNELIDNNDLTAFAGYLGANGSHYY